MHILAVIMLHFFALYQFLFCFVNIFVEIVEKKSLESAGFREGWSGYSKHNLLKWETQYNMSFNFQEKEITTL